MKVGFTGRIARAAASRPWLTIVAWVIGLTAAVMAAGSLGDALVQDDRALVPTESHTADVIAHDASTAASDGPETLTETVIVTSDSYEFADATFQEALRETATALAAIDGVDAVAGPTLDQAQPVSGDGHSALLTATLSPDHPEDLGATLNRHRRLARHRPVLRVHLRSRRAPRQPSTPLPPKA